MAFKDHCFKQYLLEMISGMKLKQLLFLVVLASCANLGGQNPVLEDYVRIGLESNTSLQQYRLDYSRSLLAIKEAKGYFFPDINLNARYTLADGGRIIEFPVGDLLNPVYNTLNLLTASNQFPVIENQEFSFYRPVEQETKISAVQPIFSSDLIHNVKINQSYSEISRVNLEQYKRELINEIKSAYYTYQKAYELNKLVDTTMRLVTENLRVSNVLYKNDLVTIDAVYRSEAEVSKLDVEKSRAKGMLRSSKAYFNFLLNRPFEEEIEFYNELPSAFLISLDEAQDRAVSQREELDLIKNTKSLNQEVQKLQKGHASPDLFAAVDYGFQGEEYKFTSENDFILASLVLRWNIFQGMSNRNKIKQARIEGEKLGVLLAETEMKIKMQVLNNYYDALASYEAIDAAKKQSKAAKKAYSLIERKYSEGQATLLEYIDARTTFSNAESNFIIAKYNYLISLADLEFSAANIDLTNY